MGKVVIKFRFLIMATAAICTSLFSFSTRLYLRLMRDIQQKKDSMNTEPYKEIDPIFRETPSYPTKQILKWSKLEKPTSSSSAATTTSATEETLLSVALVTQCSFDVSFLLEY